MHHSTTRSGRNLCAVPFCHRSATALLESTHHWHGRDRTLCMPGPLAQFWTSIAGRLIGAQQPRFDLHERSAIDQEVRLAPSSHHFQSRYGLIMRFRLALKPPKMTLCSRQIHRACCSRLRSRSVGASRLFPRSTWRRVGIANSTAGRQGQSMAGQGIWPLAGPCSAGRWKLVVPKSPCFQGKLVRAIWHPLSPADCLSRCEDPLFGFLAGGREPKECNH